MTIPEPSVAVELERLRGTVETGFARIDGQLALLVQRSDRAEEDVRQLREDVQKDVAELRGEVEELKRTRWPLASIGALTALAALGLTLYGLIAR
ncbi:hypothetical protein [Streptomyces sp. bgisy154]|uniref:hypothetical protein n=1 Tax=Streptomyces sp. bgisy154 TaxID=3413794 RepID=UPI003D74A1CD